MPHCCLPVMDAMVSMTISPIALLPMCWCSIADLSKSVLPLSEVLAVPRALSLASSSAMSTTKRKGGTERLKRLVCLRLDFGKQNHHYNLGPACVTIPQKATTGTLDVKQNRITFCFSHDGQHQLMCLTMPLVDLHARNYVRERRPSFLHLLFIPVMF